MIHAPGIVRADPPVASYIFPAGGQRGTKVNVRVGGLFLHDGCSFEMLGPGIAFKKDLHPMPTLWFEGPLLPLPESQQAEDYPKDMAGAIDIRVDAPLVDHSWRLWTAQGASSGPVKFVVGDLPEIVEKEIDGDPIPVLVQLPVTINGRIFPRGNMDIWSFRARKGEPVTCEVRAARIGSPLDSRLEVRDPLGNRIAENDDALGADSRLRFTPAADGIYQVRIHDVQFRGGPAYVYRLTLTAGPYIDCVFPLGGRRGANVRLETSGQGLSQEPIEVQLPPTGGNEHLHRLTVDGEQTNPFLLEVDDLQEYVHGEPSQSTARATMASAPAIFNGRIRKAGDVDTWAFQARKGDVLQFEARARVLDSPLHTAMAVTDSTGQLLAQSDAPPPGKLDPKLVYTVKADGTYFLQVADAFRSRGGNSFAYRIRMEQNTASSFNVRLLSDVVTVPLGGQAKIKVTIDRDGPAHPIELSVAGLPAGVTAATKPVAANQSSADITLKAEVSSAIAASALTIRGKMKLGDRTVERTATFVTGRGNPAVETVLLAVALPTPFKLVPKYDMRWTARGSVVHRHYQIDRSGYEGPLEIRLADRQARHLQGATGPVLTVKAGASDFDYPVQLAPWMETGRTCRVCIMATGRIKGADGIERRVSYSSIQPNDQVIVVVEPGRLDVEAERTSLLARRGKTQELAVRVGRARGLDGPVKLELIAPRHLQAIHADPVIVPSGQDRAQLAIRFAPDLKGPINAPITIRATLLDHGDPVIGEANLDIQTPDP